MESKQTTMEAKLMQSKAYSAKPEFGDLLWKQIYDELQRRIDPATFNSWFRNIKFLSINTNSIEIAVSSKFIKEWLSNNYLNLITKITRCFKPEILNVKIKVKTPRYNRDDIANDYTPDNLPSSQSKKLSSNINPMFKFDKMVVGDFNKIAFEAANNILCQSSNMLSGHNLLFVHSCVGMGKTHLLQAVTHESEAKNVKTIYYSAEKFSNQYVTACQNNQLTRFKTYNRNCDIFIIDDIQFIIGKPSTMQELMNTVISLIESNKSVIIACDSSPFRLSVDKRLLSRISGGVVTEINPPSLADKMKILNKKLANAKTKLDSDILDYIAQNITGSNRELEGALYKTLNHRTMMAKELTLTSVKKILHENINANNRTIEFEHILNAVSKFFDVSTQDILSRSRLKKFVYPRQIVSLLAKQLTSNSLQEIGAKLGGKDHATIIYSITKLEDKIQSDTKVRDDVSSLMKLICN